MPDPIVHIVDDDEPARRAAARLLTAHGFTVCTYGSAGELLGALEPDRPGCIVLDVQMPGQSGLDLQQTLAAGDDPLPIVFVTGHGAIPDSVRAIQRGALDFLTKPVPADVLVEAVSRALARDAENRAARARQRALRQRYARLTPREREVLTHLISGQLNKQVAGDLNIAERTIKLHRARIFEKLETDSMAGLTRIAIELGITPADGGR